MKHVAQILWIVALSALVWACSGNDGVNIPQPPPVPGHGQFGDRCTATEQCSSLLCVRDDSSEGVCSRSCTSDSECPAAPNWRCVKPDDVSHSVCACRRSSDKEICGDGLDNDCDGKTDDCEVCAGMQVSFDDPNHCGSCSNVCGADQQCVNRACTCPKGTTKCGQHCVNVA